MHNKICKILFLWIITSSLITYAGAENDVTFSSHSKPPVIHKLFGLNFSPYKNDEGPQGAHWGVWDNKGNLKPGMKTLFKGEFHEVGKGHINTPSGPGEPIIEFTFVPPLGSFKNLKGQVWHANPSDNKVIVYTYVSGWWIKPTLANPLSVIQPDGSWSTDITTGGIDQKATKITAFLVHNSYKPPLVFGDKALPEDLSRNTLAKIEVNRNQ